MDWSCLVDGNLAIKSLLCALGKWNLFDPKETHRRVGANKVFYMYICIFIFFYIYICI